jgi:hypothetical protein
MEIHVFTNSRKVPDLFEKLQRGRKHRVEFHPRDDLKGWVRNAGPEDFAYVDIQGLDSKQREKTLRLLSSRGAIATRSNGNLRYGVIDPRGNIEDSAGLFHRGAVDYVDRKTLASGLDTRRFERVLTFYNRLAERKETQKQSRDNSEAAQDARESRRLQRDQVGGIELPEAVAMVDLRALADPDTSGYRYSGSDWSSVELNTEYTFWFAHVVLNASRELSGRQSSEHTAQLVATFQQSMERYFGPVGGRIWMWKDFSGLILFPFDGTSDAPFMAAYRFMLNQTLINAEDLGLSVPLEFQIALDIGNTTYREAGKTGTIISDSVNFIFHLGLKYAPRGVLTVTSNVVPFITERMHPLVVAAGSFEGREVFSLRVPKPAD